VALCDTTKFTLELFKKMIDVRTYTDFQTMLRHEVLDFVIIATPVKFHHIMIKELLSKNISVFTEKPFTRNYAEAVELVGLIEESGLTGQVGFVNRYQRIFDKVKSLLVKGIPGKITGFSCEMYGGVVLRDLGDNWRASKEIAGGGCLMEFAIHSADMIVNYFGKPDAVTEAKTEQIYSREVEDKVFAALEYADGLKGVLKANWSDPAYRMPSNLIRLEGTNGTLKATEHQLVLDLKTEQDIYPAGISRYYITDFYEPVRIYVGMDIFTLQMDDFINAMVYKTPNRNTFHSASETSWLIEEIYRKASRL
ncbi:MAG: Gfo/Idh/MocA family oxidoreductase, partial [Candidatus Cloacimonadaceae bacterium]